MTEWDIIMIMYCFALTSIPLTLIFMEKCTNATQQRQIVRKAILDYQLECIHSGKIYTVFLHDMETYKKTCFRLWDWGYKRILPKEKFEIIKLYIK